MSKSWDDAWFKQRTNDELWTIRQKADSKKPDPEATRVYELCCSEIARRGLQEPSTPRTRFRTLDNSNSGRSLESQLSADIGAFGRVLSKKYDLSAETAQKASADVKRFQTHNLTQPNGTAKLGGLQRKGKCAMDRYISYRVRDDILSLNAFRLKNADTSPVEFHVFGPQEHLPDGQTAASLRPGLSTEQEMKRYAWGMNCNSLEDAKVAFEYVISKMVPHLET